MAFDREELLAAAARERAGEGASETSSKALPVLTFFWGEELYALPLGEIREVAKMGPLTPVPGLPPILLGAVNLRGEVLAVADVRTLFGLERGRVAAGSRLVVVPYGAERLGILADSIGDIVELSPSESEAVAGDFLSGRYVLPSGRVASLLSLPRILGALAER